MPSPASTAAPQPHAHRSRILSPVTATGIGARRLSDPAAKRRWLVLHIRMPMGNSASTPQFAIFRRVFRWSYELPGDGAGRSQSDIPERPPSRKNPPCAHAFRAWLCSARDHGCCGFPVCLYMARAGPPAPFEIRKCELTEACPSRFPCIFGFAPFGGGQFQ